MSKKSSSVLVQSEVIVQFNAKQSGKFERISALFTDIQKETLKAGITAAAISSSNKGRYVKDKDIANAFHLLASKGVTQKEIAILFNCSQPTVHQVHKWFSTQAVLNIAKNALVKLNNPTKPAVKGGRLARYLDAKETIEATVQALSREVKAQTVYGTLKEVKLFRSDIAEICSEFTTL